jgi:DNA-binding Lrp family transcriptional regulator
MASAFVLLKVENREVDEVYAEVEVLPEVIDCHKISGVYEILTHIQTETMPAIEKVVQNHIEKIKGVTSTLLLIVLELEPQEISDDIPPPKVP